MPIILKQTQMSYKDNNGDYHGINTIAETQTATQINILRACSLAEQTIIQQRAAAARSTVPGEYTELSDDVNNLKSAIINIAAEHVIPNPITSGNKKTTCRAEEGKTYIFDIESCENSNNNVVIAPYLDGEPYLTIRPTSTFRRYIYTAHKSGYFVMQENNALIDGHIYEQTRLDNTIEAKLDGLKYGYAIPNPIGDGQTTLYAKQGRTYVFKIDSCTLKNNVVVYPYDASSEPYLSILQSDTPATYTFTAPKDGRIVFQDNGAVIVGRIYEQTAINQAMEELEDSINTQQTAFSNAWDKTSFTSARIGTKKYDYTFTAGRQYMIVNESSINISTSTYSGDTKVETIGTLKPNEKITFTATENANQVAIYTDVTSDGVPISIYAGEIVNGIAQIPAVQSQLDEVKFTIENIDHEYPIPNPIGNGKTTFYAEQGKEYIFDVQSCTVKNNLVVLPYVNGDPYLSILASTAPKQYVFTAPKSGYFCFQENSAVIIGGIYKMTRLDDGAVKFHCNTFTPTAIGSTKYDYAVSAGTTYYLRNTGLIDISTSTYNGNTKAETIGTIKPGEMLYFTATTSANKLNLYLSKANSGASLIIGYGNITDIIPSLKAKTVYVDGTNGNDGYSGSMSAPVKTIAQALRMSDTIKVFSGTYLLNDGTLNLSYGKYSISAVPQNKVELKFGSSINVTYNSSTGFYESAAVDFDATTYQNYPLYNDGVPDPATAILPDEIHPAQQGHVYRMGSTRYRQYADEVALSSVDRGYYYDGTKFVIKSDQTLTSLWMPSFSYIDLLDSDIEFHGVDILYSSIKTTICNLKMTDCRVLYPSSPIPGGICYYASHIDLFRVEVCGEQCSNSQNSENTGDGICGLSWHKDYIRNELTATLIDCWLHDSQDDGFSDHGQGSNTVIGGLFEYNRKSGAMPASGVNSLMIGVTARHQTHGIAPVNNMMYGNDDDAWMGIEMIDCLCENNTYNFSIGNGFSTVVCRNCISRNGTVGYYLSSSATTSKFVLYNCYSDGDTTTKSNGVVTRNGTLVQ